MTGVRLDKWLWAARFFKTRGLSSEEIGKGRVSVNGQTAKPAREVQHRRQHRAAPDPRSAHRGRRDTSNVRGPAPVARALYEETPESIARREQAAAGAESASSRPHAIERRPARPSATAAQLADWNRWSASVDRRVQCCRAAR